MRLLSNDNRQLNHIALLVGVGISGFSLLLAGCWRDYFFLYVSQIFFCNNAVAALSRTCSDQIEFAAFQLDKLPLVAVPYRFNVSFHFLVANRAVTYFFAAIFAIGFFSRFGGPAFNRVILVGVDINNFAALLAHIVALAVSRAGCLVVGELVYSLDIHVVSALSLVSPLGLRFSGKDMLARLKRNLEEKSLAVNLEGVFSPALVGAGFLFLRYLIGIKAFALVGIE